MREQRPQIDVIIDHLRDARRKRRAVVPIVGAGLSADSGFPVLSSIMRYFGKFQQYLEKRAYLPILNPDQKMSIGDPLEAIHEDFQRRPRLFVEHFGWPNRFELNQDLLNLLERQKTNLKGELQLNPPETVTRAVGMGLQNTLDRINIQGHQKYKSLRKDVIELLRKHTETALKALGGVEDAGAVDDETRRRLAPILESLRARVNDELGKAKELIESRFEWDEWGGNVPFDLLGDWKKLIQHFTEYQGDYADALFSRFGLGRLPSLGHRFLAFLVRHLSIKTILTFNFDELIEQALECAGIHPKVFAMERGVGLPHESLVQDQVSVVKMHGSNHALLVDEQLDHPLSKEYKERFHMLTSPDPLLFVCGCSGGDYRLQDLVLHVLQNKSGGVDPKGGPRIIWLHFEPTPPPWLEKYLKPEQSPKAVSAHTNNPGATLMHCYSALTGVHPASAVPYVAHVQRPVQLQWFSLGENAPKKPADQKALEEPDRDFAVISYLDEQLGDGKKTYPLRTASQALVEAATYWQVWGHHTIWVDLEAVHTLAGVVGSIVDQCRAYDPSLAPSVLPASEEEQVINRAVLDVSRALRRSRYLVALDGLETYLWPPTAHHGETTLSAVDGAKRLQNIRAFIDKLRNERLGESKVFLSIDRPKTRNHEGEVEDRLAEIQQMVQDYPAEAVVKPTPEDSKTRDYNEVFVPLDSHGGILQGLHKSVETKVNQSSLLAHQKPEFVPEQWALVLHTLACFRRTRPLPALRSLLLPGLGGREAIDAVLNACTAIDLEKQQPCLAEIGLVRLEGGSLWFNRPVRDYLYRKNTEQTSTEKMKEYLDGPVTEAAEEGFPLAVAQLFLLAATHQRIARTWYTRTFVQSHDASTFLEYTYHRLSSVRYLAKLLAMIAREKIELRLTGKTFEGLRKFGQLLGAAIADEDRRQDVFRRMEVQSDAVAAVSSLRRAIDPKQNPPQTEKDLRDLLNNIEGNLQERHARELHNLYRAWVRSEETIREQLPAEQLLHWCDALLKDELVNRCNRVVIDYEKRTNQPVLRPESEPVNCLAEPAVKAFKTFLQDFRVKLWIERSDYALCVKARFEQLSQVLPPGRALPEGGNLFKASFFKISEDRLPPLKGDAWPRNVGSLLRPFHVHYLLDIASCLLKQGQEGACDLREAQELLQDISAWLERLERFAVLQANEKVDEGSDEERYLQIGRAEQDLQTGSIVGPAGFISDCHEARLRLQQFRSEAYLGGASVFSLGFRGERTLPQGLALNESREAIEYGRSSIRAQDPHTSGPLRGVLAEPTSDGCLYLQYRALFAMLRGRQEWLAGVGKDEGQLTAQFEEANRCFEFARAGLGEGNRLLAARNELYSVEACLGQARICLYPSRVGEEAAEQQRAMDEARGPYESARFALRRAQQALLATRRNVIWWRFYYLIVGQYHADRLLLGLAEMVQPWYSDLQEMLKARDAGRLPVGGKPRLSGRTLAEFLSRLRNGYNALRSAADYAMPPETAADPPSSPWLQRIWLEMTAAGFAVGYAALCAQILRRGKALPLLGSHNSHEQTKYIMDLLEWLNQSAGLDQYAISAWIKCLQGLKSFQSIPARIRSYFTDKEEDVLPLQLRWELVKLAAEPSGSA